MSGRAGPGVQEGVLVQGLIALVVSHSAYWKPVKSLERVRAKVATKNTI